MTKTTDKVSIWVYWVGVAFVVACLAFSTAGCNDANGVLPPGPCYVADECVEEVKDEFCLSDEELTNIQVTARRAGYNFGFRAGVASVVCEIDDDQEDECNEGNMPRGHLRKECRGNN